MVQHAILCCFTFLQGFKKISETIFKGHKYMTGITNYNVQRVVTPKAGNSESWFLCSAHHIVVIYICIRFQENISNSFQVTKLTYIYNRNQYFQYSKGHNSKSRLSRVTVLVFCTLSHNVLHLCEVLSKYLKLTEWTLVHGRNGYFQYLRCSKGSSSKGRLSRVLVHVLCTSSHGALHSFEIS